MNNDKKMSLTEIYNMYHKDILGYVTYAMKGNTAAGEVTNDTFIKSNNYEYDSEKANMRTWLRKIANGCIADYYRKNDTSLTTNVSDFQDENGNEFYVISDTVKTDSGVENAELLAKLTKVITTLNKLQQQIADLFLIKDLSQVEIAEICNIPINSVKGNITRIREVMAKNFQAEKVEHGI